MPAQDRPSLSSGELAEYLIDLGGALLSYGCPTHRLEAVIREIAKQEGCVADAFAVPTGLWMSLRGPGNAPPMVRMVRVKDWGVDLERLAHVDRLFNEVLDKKLSLAQARVRLDDIEAMRPSYAPWMSWLAAAGATGAASVFFDARPREVGIAALGGLLLGGLRTWTMRSQRLHPLTDFLGGLIAAGLAWAATALDPGMSREVLVLSVILVLVPGMAITGGLSELANKNLVSGASKLMEAMVVFLSICFGIAALVALEHVLHLTAGVAPVRAQLSVAWDAGAIVVASLCFGVIFRVPPKLLWTAILSGAIAWSLSRVGARYSLGSLATFAAALGVGMFANGAARLSQRPAQVFMLPGLMLLVPGSFGFLSLERFLRGDFLDGTAKGFEMFLVGAAITTGLLLANVVLPARKFL
jgi:uncharacterized membrane protein YjjP (DUF1212 family)